MTFTRKVLLTMRFTALILLCACLQVCAKGFSQITLSETNVPLQKVFKEIQKQTGYDFLFSSELLKQAGNVTVKWNNVSLQQALEECLKEKGLDYEIQEKTIIIKKKPPQTPVSSEESLSSIPPPIDVHGRVTDSLGNPLAGASVTVKGSKVSIATDANGEFTLNGIASNATILISYIGYETHEYKLNGKRDITLQLKAKSNQLADIEVKYSNGYEYIPKDRATGSFVQIDSALFNRTVSTNVLNRIYYVTSGLNYTPISTSANTNIQIRGISTINASQQPLVVVDGFPYDESSNNGGYVNDINPNDIESVTVLKDAAAASIWGARSGNGVIVITTKKGRFNQKPHIQFNSNVTVGAEPDLKYISTLSSLDEISVEKNLFNVGYYDATASNGPLYNYWAPPLPQVAELLLSVRNGNISQAQADAQIAIFQQHDVRDDDKKYLLQNSVNQQYALNFSGGSSNDNYYTSVGYDDNKANVIGNANKRLTLRIENYYRPVKNLEIGGFISYVQSTGYSNGIGPFLPNGSGIAPYTMLADANGNPLAIPYGNRLPYVDTLGSPFLNWQYVPLQERKNNDNNGKSYDARIGANIKYTFIPGLDAEIKYQYQNILGNSQNYYNTQTYYTRNLINEFLQIDPLTGNISYPIPDGAILNESSSQQTSWDIRGQINFSHIWKNHQVVALAGSEEREVTSNGNLFGYFGYDPNTATYATNIDYSTMFSLNPGPYSGSSYITNPNLRLPSSLQRYVSNFVNGSYTYRNKYTLSASGRLDGTNFFGINANQRTTPLWSIGAIWDISNENFYKINWLPLLKFRATYGYNGNMYNGASAYPTIFYNEPSPLNNTPYAVVSSPGNPALTWEKIKMINLAIDFGLFNQRITGSIEGYTKKGIDLIEPITLNFTTGQGSFIGNRATMNGSGADIVINSMNIKGRFYWNTNFLFSYNTDKLISYTQAADSNISASAVIGGIPIIGKSLYSLYSWKWGGLDPSNGDPRAIIDDTVASYSIAFSSGQQPRDIVYNGRLNPTFYGSIRNTLGWKSIALSFNITYKFGYVFRRSSINYINLINQWGGSSDYDKRWQNPGDEKLTNVPSFPTIANISDQYRDLFYAQSSILVDKGDHIRLQDIRLSYDFNTKSLKGTPLQSAQFYIYANNIGILWRANKDHIDPDYQSNNIPNPRSISIGLNLNFQ